MRRSGTANGAFESQAVATAAHFPGLQTMPQPWSTLLIFMACVSLLYLIQRWINQHMQGIGILLFNSRDAGMAVLWFVLLPGIILHELSHWTMAKLLGLKTGKLRMWPELTGDEIILGSVEVQKSNPLKDSLVGLAPFLGGSLALLVIGTWVFDANVMGQAWEQSDWRQLLNLLTGTLQVADSWIWLYLVVAFSNAMMPSPSDRASWRLVLIYLGLVGVALVLLGWWPPLPDQLTQGLVSGLRTLTYAFALTLVIDLVFALLLGLGELILGLIRGQRVVYK